MAQGDSCDGRQTGVVLEYKAPRQAGGKRRAPMPQRERIAARETADRLGQQARLPASVKPQLERLAETSLSLAATPPYRARPAEILQPERLGEPAGAGLLEKPLRVRAGDVAGHEHDPARHLGLRRLELAVELHPADARHLQVADDQIEVLLRGRARALRAVAGAIDDEAGVLQRLGDGGAERRLVFDDQHRGARDRFRRALDRPRHRRLQRAGADRQLDGERRAARRRPT